MTTHRQGSSASGAGSRRRNAHVRILSIHFMEEDRLAGILGGVGVGGGGGASLRLLTPLDDIRRKGSSRRNGGGGSDSADEDGVLGKREEAEESRR
ncbi:hypothetical protein HK101_011699, partial [Irineochytrium annulatum]